MGNKVKEIKTISIIFCVAAAAMASNLANPAAAIPEARVAIGASYHLGGYTLTNKEIPSIFNRLHARVHYAPLNFLGIGVDLGAMQLDVERYVFKGEGPCSMENSGFRRSPSEVPPPASKNAYPSLESVSNLLHLKTNMTLIQGLMGPKDRTSVPYPGLVTSQPDHFYT